ncbi:uncharacterized protein LOC124804652 [Schistocerca piceifrons]|uniref:uncharacterized protein LOC124804652 n=1 Tax=Schistocerca piceifrons TaxID=274613 RepID=UPI001F5EF815|nr:uncharacterized protein LOC124804652 [Schistocerca piceifrons]
MGHHITIFSHWRSIQVTNIPKDTEEWQKVARNFEVKWNFPHCIGAIYGKNAQIMCPPNTGSEYINYKKTFSIVLMAIVDANYCFQCINVGCHRDRKRGEEEIDLEGERN